jgi:sortase A
MAERASRRTYRRQRQRTGFVVFALLAVGVLGALFALTFEPWQQTGEKQPVERVNAPAVEEAPDAVAGAKKEDEKDAADKESEKKDSEEDESEQEVAPVPASTDLYLTVPKMGLTDTYVANSIDEATLHNGAGKAPFSGFPWESQANTYIAAHVLGYAGTGSYMQFANLPNMAYGDEIYLTDANGTTYTYRVTEILQVSIYDTWVMNPTGKDMVSLQTCINPPAYDIRLVVRGERVAVQTA